MTTDHNETDKEDSDHFTITFSSKVICPKQNEIVIMRRQAVLRDQFFLDIGDNVEEIKNIDCIVYADNNFWINKYGEITVEVNNHKAPIFKVNRYQGPGKTHKRQFLVNTVSPIIKIKNYDEHSFQLIQQEPGKTSFHLKQYECQCCKETYRIKSIHTAKDNHKAADNLHKLTTSKRGTFASPTETKLFLNPTNASINTWNIDKDGKTFSFQLFTPEHSKYKWTGIIYPHFYEGIELSTSRRIKTFDNMVQKIFLGKIELTTGANLSSVWLKSTKDDSLEALIPIIYELEDEKGENLYFKLTLHTTRGSVNKTTLEALQTLSSSATNTNPKPRKTKSLGSNYLKTPNEEEKSLYSPKLMQAIESIYSEERINPTKLLKIKEKHQISEEESVFLNKNLQTMEKEQTKNNFIEQTLLNTFLELTATRQNEMGLLCSPITSVNSIPGTNSSRAYINLDSSDLVRINAKPGNFLSLETKTETLTGTLEKTDDKQSSIIIQEDPSKINQWSDINLSKRENLFLTQAYFTSIKLVEENKLLDYLFPTEYTGPSTPSELEKYFQPNLTTIQKIAVQKALQHQPSLPYIITGAAGCGKSLVLTEIILQSLQHQTQAQTENILVVNPTNLGITELYAKTLEQVQKHFKNINLLKLSAPSQPLGPNCKGCFKNETETHHEYPLESELKRFNAIFCTPTIAFRLGLLQEPNLKFKTIIIDETCYQPQSETLTALSPFLHPQGQNPRVILSGDPFQLSYTPRSKAAKKGNYDISLLNRLLTNKVYKNTMLVSYLHDNYRNNKLIVAAINTLLYNNRIKPQRNMTGSIQAVHSTGITTRALNDRSSYNRVDAIKALQQAKRIKAKYPDKRVVILAMYTAQLSLLSKLQKNTEQTHKIPILTTESVQGSQSHSVIMCPSLHGTYPQERLAGKWACDIKRLCMTISRAEENYIIVGNLLLLNSIPAYRFLIEIAERTGELHCTSHIKKIIQYDR